MITNSSYYLSLSDSFLQSLDFVKRITVPTGILGAKCHTEICHLWRFFPMDHLEVQVKTHRSTGTHRYTHGYLHQELKTYVGWMEAPLVYC